MLACHLLPVESMSAFISRRRSIEVSPVYAVIAKPEPRNGLELAIQTLNRLDRLSAEGVPVHCNLRSKVWATACTFAAISSEEKLARAPQLAGLLLSEGVLPIEVEGLPEGVLQQLAKLAELEAESIKISTYTG